MMMEAIADTTETYGFKVGLRLTPQGREVVYEPIFESDLTDMYSEAWLGHLRKGHPDWALEDLHMHLMPVFNKDEEHACTHLILAADGPTGEKTHTLFDIHALAHVAERASKEMIRQGTLKAGNLYYYKVLAERGEPPGTRPRDDLPSGLGQVTVRRAPLIYLKTPLQPLLDRAEIHGLVDGWCPVFYPRNVLEKAEKYSRRGAKCVPPVESGGVIIGSLCSCPESGEFFVLATEVIEVADALQTGFSLTYSSKTWNQIQAVLRARQANPATRAERIVGQAHGHNFLPDHDGKTCGDCEKQATCQASSVYVSEQDLLWTRSVLARNPWSVCHIFGLDTRGHPVHGQFGFRGGRLQERGFYLLEDQPLELNG